MVAVGLMLPFAWIVCKEDTGEGPWLQPDGCYNPLELSANNKRDKDFRGPRWLLYTNSSGFGASMP